MTDYRKRVNVHLLWQEAIEEWGATIGLEDYEVFADKLAAAILREMENYKCPDLTMVSDPVLRTAFEAYEGTQSGHYDRIKAVVTAVQRELAQDEALMRQALDALEYHVEQTRPINRTADAVAALRERLGVTR